MLSHEKKRKQSNSRQLNHLSKQIKILKSFDQKQFVKRTRFLTDQNEHIKSFSDNPCKLPIGLSAPSKPKFNQFNPAINQQYRYETINKDKKVIKCSQSQEIQPKRVKSNHFLPSINSQLKSRQKNHSISTMPLKSESRRQSSLGYHSDQKRISFTKIQGVPNGNLLQYLKMKPHQKYWSKLQNVRLAQKLLLAQPSKQLRRCEHQKFYLKQSTYRNKISHSSLMKKRQSESVVKKSKIRLNSISKSDWIN